MKRKFEPEVPDYYHVLRIPQSSTASEIRQAYRSLAVKWHPDKNPGNQAEAKRRFQELSRAFGILGEPAKRRQYDQDKDREGPSPGTFVAGPSGASSFFLFRSSEETVGVNMNFAVGGRIESNLARGFVASAGGTGSSNSTGVAPNSASERVSANQGRVCSSYYSSSTSTTTVIRHGQRLTMKRTVTVANGVEVTEVFENDRLVSSTTRNV